MSRRKGHESKAVYRTTSVTNNGDARRHEFTAPSPSAAVSEPVAKISTRHCPQNSFCVVSVKYATCDKRFCRALGWVNGAMQRM
jgi:hypothetical protein